MVLHGNCSENFTERVFSTRLSRSIAHWLCAILITPIASADVDLSGPWMQKMHEDLHERAYGPDVGDYAGLPINDAARMRAETWDAAKWSVPEHQCEPHPADYAPHGPAALRIWSEVDPVTQTVVAWHIVYLWMNSHRVIWMDGRSHPPPEAPYTWMGFSTGKWVGDTLVVTTTHLKEGWIRRNGVPRSDLGKLTEYWMRLGNYLTVLSAVEDPVYLTEPMVRSWNWVLDPGYQLAPYNCTYRVETELPRGFVAHHLPGQNPLLTELRQKSKLPVEASRGGAETMYPEFVGTLKWLVENPGKRPPEASATAASRAKSKEPAKATRKARRSAGKAAAGTTEVHALHVKGNVYMLVGAGVNTAVQIGNEGVLVVDTQPSHMSEQLLAAIRKLSDKPIRYVLNTSAGAEHTGGNAAVAKSGVSVNTFSGLAAYSKPPESAPIYAHENVLKVMSRKSESAPVVSSEAWPTETYFTDSMELHFNGEAIRLLHMPAAHSDGDSIVYFQQSNVVVAGDVFGTLHYPVIDVSRGGTVNGLIEALNRIIDITVPEKHQEGGTMVIPGHGRITDEYEVVMYRDMVTIIRDRVKHLIEKGMTLDQVHAAGWTVDYDGRYRAKEGEWTTRDFVEAVYRSLMAEKESEVSSTAGESPKDKV